MKWTQGYFFTLKEDPADAEIPSHKLMVRAGFIKKLSQGIYTYGPLALRSLRKLETILREELDACGCVEVLMPVVQPKDLWVETGRWDKMGKGLLKFKNRVDQEYCLGATHEEVITDYVRGDVKSYRDLPVTLYQIQTKYRDEIRPRFGLLRGREFLMKDAYSFDVDQAGAMASYKKMAQAYRNIFSRLGVQFTIVKADSGAIGGNFSEEFHVLAESGEDQLLVSDSSDFAANIEACPGVIPSEPSSEKERAKEEFPTPGLKTIQQLSEALKTPPNELVKTLFYSAAREGEKELKPVAVLLRGGDELNPTKLKNLLGLNEPPPMLTDEEVRQVTGASPGSCGPVGLKIPVYMDESMGNFKNYVVGANRDGFHLRNVNHPRDFAVTQSADLRAAAVGDPSPDGRGRLKTCRGIEVGHIFYLGDAYSKSLNARFLDRDGKSKVIEMGCYGIGVSRTLQATIEQNHDKDGMIWPVAIAPFEVHICLLDPTDAGTSSTALEIYNSLRRAGADVLLDDRDERPGVKFKDADLMGMPLRLTIGKRGLQAGEVEFTPRKSHETQKAPVGQTVEKTLDWLKTQGWRNG